MARGRLAKIGMLRRLIRVKSTLPRRPSPSLRRVSLRRVSPRRSPRRAAPPAAPLLSLPWRFYTSRSLAWRFCTLKARAARNNAATMEPTCRNAAPPSFRRSVSSRLGHLYVSKEPRVPGVSAAGCPQPQSRRRAHVSSRLGRLYVSCGTCLRSDVSRPPMREGAPFPRHPRTSSASQTSAQKSPHHEDAGPPKPAASR